ncbi:contractile injection system tape measure protein [Fibrobacter sp. UWH6]|uniref:contractile injection system tape measure protein n=1 Tax=Fibrobacter sp. (strain UWH6) TaxID=1896212 RepID=UPI0009195DDA|nr:contractile injection system tape measure protein [Fibrobacter sp. UWH6]MCQ2098953.1 hypothetical protein [Fibrobacter sp.]SHK70528.1 hypothetical protein SAMN05720765_104161 [Fibrobacter sp. UWH6]
MNVIDNLTLNIVAADSQTCQNLEGSLYSFARNTLIDILDQILNELDFDGELEIDDLTIDVGEVDSENALQHFSGKLPVTLKESLSKVVFKKHSQLTLNMLSETYRRLLPINQVMNIEKEFEYYAEEWLVKNPNSKFDPLAVSEYIIKIMMQRNPGLDFRQIACSVYQNIKRMERPAPQKISPKETRNVVHDAGLVLLAPYIPVLLGRLGCVSGNTFTSEDARLKGLSLLKYAVYGSYEVPKTPASLMNIICGYDRSFDSEKLPILSDDDKSVVNSLLDAVVKNWGALGSTSADGLRTSFLIRSGSIEDVEDGLLLKVSSSAYDMLLDKLPWGYSMVKTSWMKSKISVAWR